MKWDPLHDNLFTYDSLIFVIKTRPRTEVKKYFALLFTELRFLGNSWKQEYENWHKTLWFLNLALMMGIKLNFCWVFWRKDYLSEILLSWKSFHFSLNSHFYRLLSHTSQIQPPYHWEATKKASEESVYTKTKENPTMLRSSRGFTRSNWCHVPIKSKGRNPFENSD